MNGGTSVFPDRCRTYVPCPWNLFLHDGHSSWLYISSDLPGVLFRPVLSPFARSLTAMTYVHRMINDPKSSQFINWTELGTR